MYIFTINIFGINISPSYYGLMYAISFLLCYYVVFKRNVFEKKDLESLFFYIFFGVVLGGRIGYILFYNLSYYLQNPLKMLYFTEGGMSFHGGVLGVIFAMFLFSKIKKISFLKVSDQVTSVLPIGLFFGRIGNYINKELLGFSPYNGLLAIEKNGTTYFPSTLLEAFLEGIVLFLILFFAFKSKNIKLGQISALFLVFYAIFRIFVEIFFREPDSHIGYIFGKLTMGEILSLPMLIIGLILFFYFRKNEKHVS